MASPSLDIVNGWQSPRISFTLNLPQTDTERVTNDWQSPSISFSPDLPQNGRISLEKRKGDVEDVNCDTDFEFCVNGLNSMVGETLISVADELYVDGENTPLIHGPVEPQPVPIARHVGLESLRCLSPVRSTSSPSSKITNSCWGNGSSISLRHKPPNKWKEIMSLPSNKENVCAENRRTISQRSSTKSLWSFSRSCSMAGEIKGNGLLRSLSFSRSHSTAECKYKAATSGYTCKETETGLSGPVEGSKLSEACSISNKVQPEPRYYSVLKPRSEAEDGKEETKAKQYTAGRGKLGSPGQRPASRMGGDMNGQRRVCGNGRLRVPNWERSSSTAAKAARLASPPPGKPMAEGSSFVKANKYMGGGGVRVSPVVNVTSCIARRNGGGGGGLFGFFSKREKKQP